MNEYEIKSVKIVSGENLNSRWHTPMQIIETDKGTFIDNLPKEQFGFYRVANPGYDWDVFTVAIWGATTTEFDKI